MCKDKHKYCKISTHRRERERKVIQESHEFNNLKTHKSVQRKNEKKKKKKKNEKIDKKENFNTSLNNVKLK